MRRALALAGLSFLLSVGPVAAGDAPALGDVPHVQQKGELGGEACVEMWCRKLGKSISQEDVFDQSGADPALGRGCSADELVVSLKKLGFKAERPEPFESTSPEKTRQVASLKFTSGLKADLDRGVPCVVEMRCEDKPDARTAFRLFLRHDVATDEVVFHDPSRADGASSRLKKDAFLALWPITKGEETRVVRIALEAEKVVEPKRPAGFAPSAYALHVMNRRARLGEDAKGFAIVIEPPFVVLGDEPIERVRSRSAHTVRWAVTKLKQDYFEKDPDEILEVWLLKDKESYERNAKRVFGDTPTTPYGYYSHAHKALIMNIATGGGTLVHEIVHPYVAANFPDCPTWLNEGLGSLYEQSAEKDGRIVGLTNWRLEGLKKAIDGAKLPTFEKLASLSASEFYGEDRGANYAQARYLLYYMQEHGLLVKLWKRFLERAKEDPTGYATLKDTLGEKDMPDFQKRWERYVSSLTFP